MSNVLKRGTAMLAVMIASVAVATTALAQMPTSPWKKGAPFPEADEELYGVTTNGKLYVFGGWDGGKARGVAYEYDPATDKWTKKTSMPRPAHHAALAAANGKIYVMGGFVPPKDTAIPVGGAWEPIDNAWEYDPAADSWKSLPPLPGKRGSAIAAEVGGKIYVIGGATTTEGSKDPFFSFFGPVAGARHQRGVRPGHEQVGEPPADVGAAQPRVQRRRQRQDLRHRRPDRARLHPVGHEHRCGGGVQPGQRHVERAEGTDADRAQRRRVGLGRPPDLRRRRRGDDQGSGRGV